MRALELDGNRYHLLTVLCFAGIYNGRRFWMCYCECGEVIAVRSSHLVSNSIRSCGCLKIDGPKIFNRTHGYTAGGTSPEYHAYINARKRCNDTNDNRYYTYGARGIEFRFKSFEEFIGCIGDRPSKDHSLDRIVNDGHYEPGNIRWATRDEQIRGRTITVWVEVNGRRMCLKDACRESGVSLSKVQYWRKKGREPSEIIKESMYAS